MASEFDRQTLPDLLRQAIMGLQTAQDALVTALQRFDPSYRARKSSGSPSEVDVTPADSEEEILGYVASGVRRLYRRFRDEVLSWDGVESRPAPVRNGQRVYEGFSFAGRNRIYAAFRKGFVRVDFELPRNHGLSSERVWKGGGRDWARVALRREEDLEEGLKLARDTIDGIRE